MGWTMTADAGWDEAMRELARLRRENKRLRGWLRRVPKLSDEYGEGSKHRAAVRYYCEAALRGKPVPKVSR